MKPSRLKSDPAKVAAFVARGRASQALKRSAGLARTNPRPSRQKGAQSGRPVEPRWESSPECAAVWAFVAGKPCIFCRSTRHVQPHHVTSKRAIRNHVMALRLVPGEERAQARLAMLGDTRNIVPLCAGDLGCHDQLENRRLIIPRSFLPASALEFAAELGDHILARLERRYP